MNKVFRIVARLALKLIGAKIAAKRVQTGADVPPKNLEIKSFSTKVDLPK